MNCIRFACRRIATIAARLRARSDLPASPPARR